MSDDSVTRTTATPLPLTVVNALPLSVTLTPEGVPGASLVQLAPYARQEYPAHVGDRLAVPAGSSGGRRAGLGA